MNEAAAISEKDRDIYAIDDDGGDDGGEVMIVKVITHSRYYDYFVENTKEYGVEVVKDDTLGDEVIMIDEAGNERVYVRREEGLVLS